MKYLKTYEFMINDKNKTIYLVCNDCLYKWETKDKIDIGNSICPDCMSNNIDIDQSKKTNPQNHRFF